MITREVDVFIPREFKELFNEEWRNILYYGGRGSSKSHSVARALILRARAKKLRILCTREIQLSIEDSSFQLLKDIIDQYGFTDYSYTGNVIKNKLTGSVFTFKGLKKGTTDSVKSLEGTDIVWVEEAQSVSKESLEILAPTIRTEGSQLIFTFNRKDELDPVFVKYVKNVPPRTYSKMINYDVAQKYGIFPKELEEEMEHDKATDYPLYIHKWLGEPVSQSDNAIVSRAKALEAMERDIKPEGAIEVGVDVARKGNDRTEFYKRHGLKIIDRVEYIHLETTQVCDRLEQFINYDKDIPLKIDDTGVGGGVTDDMKRRGYNVVPVNFGEKAGDPDKYPNLISEAWFYLASIIDEVDIPFDDELLNELTTREWKMDNKGRRGVESKDDYKKRGNRSPDKADALILCFYNKEVITPAVRFI